MGDDEVMERPVHVEEMTFGSRDSLRYVDDLIFDSDITPLQLAQLTYEFDVRGKRARSWASGSEEFREVLKCSRFASIHSRRLEEISGTYTPESTQVERLAPREREVSTKRRHRLTPVTGVNTKRLEELTQAYDVSNNPLKTRLEYYLDINLDNCQKDSKSLEGSQSTGSRGRGRGSPGSFHRLHAYSTRKDPTFYIGGGNGVAQVERPLLDIGWVRIMDKHEDTFRLKWVECESSVNFNIFKEGQQLVNHIPNCYLLTNKLGLLNSLQCYDRVCMGIRGREPKLRIADFIPETYRLEDSREREKFFERFKPGELWICKPDGLNQGRGIYIVRDAAELRKQLEMSEVSNSRKRPHKPHLNRLIQRYLHDPLLLNGKKFDIRTYMLVASTCPYLLLYHNGYARLSMNDYDVNSENLVSHLTNQFIQKRDPSYKDVKEETAWSMDRFNDYINDHVMWEKGLEEDWVYNVLVPKMKQIILHCFNSVKYKLECKLGYFDLYGLDFMVDSNMKVWLIEINSNPCLATNCEALKEVIPDMIRETLYLVIECWEKAKSNQPLLPLRALRKFQVLYCASSPRTNKTPHAHRPKASSATSSISSATSPTQTVTPSGASIQYRAKSSSPSRMRSRSLSPVKETQKPTFSYLRRQSVRSVLPEKANQSQSDIKSNQSDIKSNQSQTDIKSNQGQTDIKSNQSQTDIKTNQSQTDVKSQSLYVASSSDVSLSPVPPIIDDIVRKSAGSRDTEAVKRCSSGDESKGREDSAIPPKVVKTPRTVSYKAPYEASKSPVSGEPLQGFTPLNQLNVSDNGTKSTPSLLLETPRLRASGQSEQEISPRQGRGDPSIVTFRPVRHSSAHASVRSHPAMHPETREFRGLAASSTTSVVEDAAKTRNSRINAYPLRTSSRASPNARGTLPMVDQPPTPSVTPECVKLKLSHLSPNPQTPRDPTNSNTTITYLGTFQGQPEAKVQGQLLPQPTAMSYLLAQSKLGQGQSKSGQTTLPDVRDSSESAIVSVAPASTSYVSPRGPKPASGRLPRRVSNRDNLLTSSVEEQTEPPSRGN